MLPDPINPCLPPPSVPSVTKVSVYDCTAAWWRIEAGVEDGLTNSLIGQRFRSRALRHSSAPLLEPPG